jgi:hypothetical protein
MTPHPVTPQEAREARYPWKDAPDWAMYAATDECGGAYWFESEPTAGVLACWAGGKFKRIMSIRPDWRDSLEARPTANTLRERAAAIAKDTTK